MKLETNDFVWLYSASKNIIEWGVVINEKIIYQHGGFEDVDDFDEDLICKLDSAFFLGGVVRNAPSFNSAKAFYEHWAKGEDRFLDHHTKMTVIHDDEDAAMFYFDHIEL
ncbi:MAG: hypothetical protein KBT27_08445 [Prevotellaceae bacterium]|nr:hypothetical protein [Candidatus Faecinaster equi]